MATTSKILIQVEDEVIELKGAEKETFLAQQEKDRNENLLLEAEYKAKQEARQNAIKKLAEVAGLSEAEINAIL